VETLDVGYWKRALRDVGREVEARRQWLCELDGAIGDGDHGTSMALGFRKVAERLDAEEFADVGAVLRAAGMTLVSSVGGVTGVIFGTLFMGAAGPAGGKEGVGARDLASMLAASLEAVKQRGKVQPGDKSMLDALAPAVKALQGAADEGADATEALARAGRAAAEGAENTREMVARVGRARYQGEKAVGHVDAGAASTALIFETLARTASAGA
jgi:dihydroxyacetone kinase-like protein